MMWKNIILNQNTLFYRCGRVVAHKKLKTARCPIRIPARKNTFFDSKLSLKKVAWIVAYFCHLKHPRNALIPELSISRTTVVDWSNFCREVCIEWCNKNSMRKIGGPGKIVEIDEAKVGKRKNHKGRVLEGQLIFGGIEKGSSNIFIVPVADRTAETLIPIIQQYILPQSTIMSDCWRSFHFMEIIRKGFDHFTVNHTYNFVDPDTGAHTQTIERLWRDVKSNIPRFGTRPNHYEGYLAEFLFKRCVSPEDRITVFFEQTKTMYKCHN